MFLPDNLLLLLCVQGTHLQKSYGFTTEMRSRSQRTSTSSRKVAGTACVSRRCSQRTRAHTPVRPGTVLGRSAPGPYSLCKVKLGCFEGLGYNFCQSRLEVRDTQQTTPVPLQLRGRSLTPSQALAEWGFLPFSKVPALSGLLLS